MATPSTANPARTVRDAVSICRKKLVPPSSTTDTATWNTTSAFLSVSQRESDARVSAPRSVGATSTRVALSAGASPKATPVTREIAAAKPRTR